jgi:carboxyl-terminal processing protease
MRLCLLLLLLWASGCQGRTAPLSARDQMAEDLQQFHRAVTDGWAYRDLKRESRGVDVDEIRDRLLRRITNETTPAEFALILKEFAASLHDGHAEVFTDRLLAPPSHTWPVGFMIVKEGIIVANLNWLAENPGIQLGDRLVGVNGATADEDVANRTRLTSASTVAGQRLLAVDQMHFTDSPSVRFSLERPNGESFEVDLKCLPQRVDYRHRDRTEFCTFTRLPSGVGILRIPQFTWNDQTFQAATTDQERDAALVDARQQIDAAFESARDVKGMILDLRGNGGGFELLSSYVAEHLVAGDFLYYSSERRDSDFVRSLPAYANLPAEYFGRRIPNHPRRWTTFRHFEGDRFDGPLVVLINSRCFSTTDNLCAFLKDSRPTTRFVGQPTGAGTGEPMVVTRLPHCGAEVQLCVSRIESPLGRFIEGTGTSPDVLVEPTRDDLLRHRDPALQAAESMFENW